MDSLFSLSFEHCAEVSTCDNGGNFLHGRCVCLVSKVASAEREPSFGLLLFRPSRLAWDVGRPWLLLKWEKRNLQIRLSPSLDPTEEISRPQLSGRGFAMGGLFGKKVYIKVGRKEETFMWWWWHTHADINFLCRRLPSAGKQIASAYNPRGLSSPR